MFEDRVLGRRSGPRRIRSSSRKKTARRGAPESVLRSVHRVVLALINERKEKSGKCARFWHVGDEKYVHYFGRKHGVNILYPRTRRRGRIILQSVLRKLTLILLTWRIG